MIAGDRLTTRNLAQLGQIMVAKLAIGDMSEEDYHQTLLDWDVLMLEAGVTSAEHYFSENSRAGYASNSVHEEATDPFPITYGDGPGLV